MDFNLKIEEIADYIEAKFNKNVDIKLAYHNLTHTKNVVENAKELSEYHELNEEEKFIIIASAWFHDISYLDGLPTNGHEERSAKEAKAFLKTIDSNILDAINKCILATKFPQKPRNLLEEILCDADLYHLGTNDFNKYNKLIKQECELKKQDKISARKWSKDTVTLFNAHHFHTKFGKEKLAPRKQKNLEKLMEKKNKKKGTKGKSLDPKPTRGIETMFRVSSSNQQRLSDMADNKAHILISTTSIIISVILSILFRQLDEYSFLVFPTFILLAISVCTMVFAILATRPRIPDGKFTREDVDAKKVNFLFFGNFYKTSYDEYSRGMKIVMNDSDYLYENLTKDLHSQGVVLGQKYKLLRVAYNIFMYGIVISVLSFIVATLINQSYI